MRKQGFQLLLGVSVIIGLWAFFFGERFLERRLEQAVTRILETTVEIDDLKLYRDPAISFAKLKIVDPNNPSQNLIEIGQTGFFIEFLPLLYGKVIIDRIRITDVQFWTQRKTEQEVQPVSRKTVARIEEIKESLRSQIQTPPIGDLLMGKKVAANQLISLLELPSLDKLHKMKLAVDSTYQNSKMLLAEYKQKFGRIEKNTNGTAQSTPSTEFLKVKKKVNNDFGKLNIDLLQIDRQIEKDLSNLKNNIMSFKINPVWIGKMLYGKLTVRAIGEILRYVYLVRKNIPVPEQHYKNSKVKDPKNGQDIHFAISNSEPIFLIREFIVKSPPDAKEAREQLRVRGEIYGLTSHPESYDEFQKIEISARYPGPRKYGIIATINHTKSKPWEQFQLLGTGYNLFRFDMPKYRYLPQTIITRQGKLSGGFEIDGEEVRGRIGVTAIPATFQFAETSSKDSLIIAGIRSALESRKRFYVGVRLQGTFDDLKLQVYSSIDIKLAPELEKILNKKVTWDQNELYLKADSLLTATRYEVTQIFKNRQNEIKAQISNYMR